MDRNTNQRPYAPASLLAAGAARTLAMHARGLQYTVFPETLAKDITSRASLVAKLITRELGVPRHAAFDAVARAGGFADWQHLSRHLAGAPRASRDVNWGKALAPLLLLTYVAEPGFAVPAPLLAAFRDLADKLGRALGSPAHSVLDRVCAPLLGERAWAAVEARRTTGDGSPHYRFEVEGQGTAARGEFRPSRHAQMLTDELDDMGDIPEALEDVQNEEVREAWLSFVSPLEDEHPDFLEGGLALARLRAQDNARAGLETATRYIRRAESLIPGGFRGKLWYGRPANEFYFKLLWLQADLATRAKDPGAAAQALRKIDRRIVERQVFDARWALPYALLLAGDGQAASKACDKLPRMGASFALVARAFTAFACGDRSTFRRNILKASFILYGLRDLLTLVNIPGSVRLEHIYSTIKGGAAFNRMGLKTLHQVPGLLPATLAVLNAPDALRLMDASWADFLELPDQAEAPAAWQVAVDAWTQGVTEALEQLTATAK